MNIKKLRLEDVSFFNPKYINNKTPSNKMAYVL